MFPSLHWCKITQYSITMATEASRISVNESTYFLFLKEAPCPNRSSRSLGNNLLSVSDYKSHHSNTVFPGQELNIHQLVHNSSHFVLLHNMGHEGLNSHHPHLLMPMAAAQRRLLSSTVHSTFCKQITVTDSYTHNKYGFWLSGGVGLTDLHKIILPLY